MFKKFILFTFITFLSVFPVHADSPALLSSYKTVSPNNKYVFVMIAPSSLEQELKYHNEESQKTITSIRETYAQSGMYSNDDSKTLLWSVNWFSFNVEIANDGAHLVRPGPWASYFGEDAISFYENGKLLRSYRIDELVKKKRKLVRTSSHFFWAKEKIFDREKMKYYLGTLDNRHYIFDVVSGELVVNSR